MNQTRQTALRLWTEWTRMWNGAPPLARDLVGPHFTLHLSVPGTDPRTVCDPVSVERWVAGFLAGYTRIEFDTRCGPFVDEASGIVSGPWTAAAIKDGAAIRYAGIDILGVADGRIVEYWTQSREIAGDAGAGWTVRPRRD
jgi:hypothetical protein